MEFFANRFFLLFATFAFFILAKNIQKRTGFIVLNPILLTIIFIILMLVVTGVPYDVYHESGELIDFWLQPAVVALGVPMYKQLKVIRKKLLPILISQLAGCFVGLASVTVVARMLGASMIVVRSLAPKSVTTPIAIEVSKTLGGIPSLTAAVVIVVGIIGAVLGIKILEIGRIRDNMAIGLSIGAASHALGASKAMELNSEYGAYASLGLILNGLFTALFSPIILDMLGIIN